MLHNLITVVASPGKHWGSYLISFTTMLSTNNIPATMYNADEASIIITNKYSLKVGPRQLYRYLEMLGVIDAWNNLEKPYDTNGMFEMKQTPLYSPNTYKFIKISYSILVSDNGIRWLAENLPAAIRREKETGIAKKRGPKYEASEFQDNAAFRMM